MFPCSGLRSRLGMLPVRVSSLMVATPVMLGRSTRMIDWLAEELDALLP